MKSKNLKYLDLAALLVAFYGSIVWGTYIYLNVTPIKKIVILFIIVVEIEGYFLSKFKDKLYMSF